MKRIMAIVYRHLKKTDLKVFYIGIGYNEKRAYSINNRNNYWRNVAKKNDYIVEIIAKNLDWEIAKELEMLLISQYGRIDKGTGILVNMTDGGDGVQGLKFSEETKKQMSNSQKGKKRSAEAIEKVAKTHRGKITSEETKLKMSIAKKGRGFSEEHKMKLKEAWKTRPPITDKTKKKLSESAKADWIKRKENV